MVMPRGRILYVVNAFELDAPMTVTVAVAKALVRDGWTVAMVAWSRGGKLECELDADGMITGTLHGARSFALAKCIREFQPDIVHSILARPTLGMLFARAVLPGRKFRWIAGDHGVHEWHEKGKIIGMAMDIVMPAILQVCDSVVTVSGAAKRHLLEKGIADEHVSIVPNGIDSRTFYPRSRAERCAFVAEHFPGEDAAKTWPLIGSAGNLRSVKNFELVIQAMPQILAVWPTARLVIWGEGPERKSLEELAYYFQLEDIVKLPGKVDHIEQLFPLLDLYVQPSHEESFGMAAAEAMCCGVPAVLSKAGGLPELADHGHAARLFDPDSSKELVTAILTVLENKRGLQKQGAAGRGWILGNYTKNQMVARMKDFYEQSLDDSIVDGSS